MAELQKIRFTLLQAGFCTHPEWVVIQGGRHQSCHFPSTFALIEHETLGYVLFDTGYTQRFHKETDAFPNKIYGLLTPVHCDEQDSARRQLLKRGISPHDVALIVISHFHADHVAGLRDFPNAAMLCLESCYRAVQGKAGLPALKAGFLKGLLPDDFEERSAFLDNYPVISIENEFSPFETGYALTDDFSLIAVELPGHVVGHIGLIVRVNPETVFFLVADACWLSDSYRRVQPPHPVTRLILSDMEVYTQTLKKLNQLSRANPRVTIVPSHCHEMYQQLAGKTYASID